MRRRRWLGVAVLAPAIGLVVRFRRQIVSHLTHWQGAPTKTWPYVAFDPPPALHLAVLGDIGHVRQHLQGTAEQVVRLHRSTPYDGLLLLGDNAYPNGDPAKLRRTVDEPFAPLLDDGVDLLAVLGNHDVRDGHGPAQAAALGMAGRWWATRLGDVLIVGLDSNDASNAEQRAWLERSLATTDATWRIVALHHPPYSSGYQGSSRAARQAFTPIFERAGVQLVLSGHEHDYQRTGPINGVTYVVTGSASHARRTGRAGFTAVAFGGHHFVDIGIDGDRLVLRAVDQRGRVADECRITAA